MDNCNKWQKRKFQKLTKRMFKLTFQKVATEIEHILRLSRLKEYASHLLDFSYGSSQ